METKKNGETKKNSTIIKSVGNLLNEIVTDNMENYSDLSKSSKANGSTLEKSKNSFTSKKPPSISIQSYLERIIKYTKIEDSTIIIALIYIDKLCDRNEIQLTAFNIHRIILAAFVLAIKYNEDDYYSNEFYGKVGGVTLPEINKLELEFIIILDHSLFVHEDVFNKYSNYLKTYLK